MNVDNTPTPTGTHAIMLKINLNYVTIAFDPTCADQMMEDMHKNLCLPFFDYLESETRKKKPVEIIRYSLGYHCNGRSGKAHLHLNIVTDGTPNNVLTNYKYYYRNKHAPRNFEYMMETPEGREAISDTCDKFFKVHTHSIRTSELTDEKGLLAYPFKECVDETNSWKAYKDSQVHPHTIPDLITYGAGIYLKACRDRVKIELKEAEKIEKWTVFCKQMDDLRNTPTGNEMRDLRGVVLVALDYFKRLTERTSVNVVINMCKDYCFKRGIWTNQEILDKYQIA